MIAAKQMDPVVGVDIHIIQPPGPVPPVPVPHPFVGMLMDPFDFAPVVGGTVIVNGIPRATAGTGGKCVPPHIPIGGVFVKPPGNECEVFMGSSTVLADGEPLSFLGMPALSCHDIGMPPPPRVKKKKAPKSLFMPTSVVLSVPAGAPVLVGGPPTISMMAMGMKAAMAGAGKAFKKLRKLQKASKRLKALSDKAHAAARKAMNKLGVPPSVQNRVHRAVCTVTGHPVDVATGKVLTEAMDFELPGPIPFRWERVWYSCSVYDGPLGHGWHHCYDLALIEEDGAVSLRMADGRAVAFPALGAGQEHFERQEKLTLFRDESGYGVRDARRRIYRFLPRMRPGELQPLHSIEDRNGSRIGFHYDLHLRLTGITDSAGRNLGFEYDDRGRITGLLAPSPDRPGQVSRVVTYGYDAAGDLVEVRDAAGHSFRYLYRNHLLVRETDRNGLSFYFEYDGAEHDARCVRTWGDDGIFARRLTYDTASRRTSVVDTRGGEWSYYWNELGLVTQQIDPLGNVSITEWNEYAEKVAETDPLGAKVELAYDEAGRIVRMVDPSGGARTIVYDAAGNAITLIDELGAEWLRAYDERGNVLVLGDPTGASFRLEYEARGYPVRVIDPLGRESRYEWDLEGNLRLRQDRAGGVTRLEYDRWGRLVRRRDGEGGETRIAWDLVGRIMGFQDEEGRIARFTYDPEGNLTVAVDPLGRTRRYTYGPRAQLQRVEQPSGETTEYRYDAEGELVEVRDALGRSWRFEYDLAGRVVDERDFTGRRLRYEYDAAGRLSAVENARGQVTRFARDATGRLVKRVFADGEEESFEYDAKARLVVAENSAARAEFTYDPLGRVVEEALNGERVESRFDALGNRVERLTPLGTPLTLTYDAVNRLAQLADPLGSLLELQHDSLGRETRRSLPSGIVSERQYARTGELLRQSTRTSRGGVLLDRSYRYDRGGQLEAVEDRAFGTTSFEHDPDGHLTAAVYPDGRVQRYVYDRAGNVPGAPLASRLFDARDVPERQREVDGWRLRFDADGNLIEKQNGSVGYRYHYNAAGRLERVERTDGLRVEFAYDALGRRIRRSSATRTTEFVWDRDWLAFERVRQQELSPGHAAGSEATVAREYVFHADSLVPIAMREADRTLLLETDQIGMPRLAVNRDGDVEWQADFGGFGESREIRGAAEVPFRFPGQQFDEETGLYYNRFRYYDPDLRMYTQPDPLGLAGGEHPHNYVPDPTSWTDPLGLAGLDDPGYSVYQLEKKNAQGQWEPFYTGISNDPDRRLQEHIRDGRVTEQGLADQDLRMNIVEDDLKYAEARGAEQAYMEHSGTRTARPGDNVGVGTGNKVNSFDHSRTDPRGTRFEAEYKKKKLALSGCP